LIDIEKADKKEITGFGLPTVTSFPGKMHVEGRIGLNMRRHSVPIHLRDNP